LHAASKPVRDLAPRDAGPGGACPIADAVRPLRRHLAARDPIDRTRVDVVETLATLLDLTGSMALAVHLDAPPPDAAGGAAPLAPTQELVGWVDERLGQLRAAVARRLRDLPGSRSAIWGPDRLAAEISRRGLAKGRRARAVAALAREATDAWALAIRGLLERIRSEARGLRVELGPRLAAVGPDAARLEALDALVARARSAGTHRLLARIPPALVDDFAARLGLALSAIDEEALAAGVEDWYATDGFVVRFQADAARIVRAVLEHEHTALHELCAAAEALEDR
jgi:hypothetical protein